MSVFFEARTLKRAAQPAQREEKNRRVSFAFRPLFFVYFVYFVVVVYLSPAAADLF